MRSLRSQTSTKGAAKRLLSLSSRPWREAPKEVMDDALLLDAHVRVMHFVSYARAIFATTPFAYAPRASYLEQIVAWELERQRMEAQLNALRWTYLHQGKSA